MTSDRVREGPPGSWVLGAGQLGAGLQPLSASSPCQSSPQQGQETRGVPRHEGEAQPTCASLPPPHALSPPAGYGQDLSGFGQGFSDPGQQPPSYGGPSVPGSGGPPAGGSGFGRGQNHNVQGFHPYRR